MNEIAVLLHNVRSAHNVGSIFRTSDAAGVSKMFLTGYTPTPTDRFARPRKDIAKTALGAETFIPWQYEKSATQLIQQLRNDGWCVVGVEQDVRSIDYSQIHANEVLKNARVVYVFGNEVKGLSKNIRDTCDILIEIPMRGAMVRQAHHPRQTKHGKESLNVSVSAGIILFNGK